MVVNLGWVKEGRYDLVKEEIRRIKMCIRDSMRSVSLMMQSSVGVSKNMVDIIQGLVIVFLCAENVIRYYIKKRRGGK